MKIKDSVVIGTIVGIICPALGILIFYLLNFNDQPLMDFLSESITNKLLSPLLSLCAILNLGIFYLFLQRNKLYSARGVIFSTIIYGLTIVILKFVI